jgi:hypothetical protein
VRDTSCPHTEVCVVTIEGFLPLNLVGRASMKILYKGHKLTKDCYTSAVSLFLTKDLGTVIAAFIVEPINTIRKIEKCIYCVKFEVLAVVVMTSYVFWDITACSSLKVTFTGYTVLYLRRQNSSMFILLA